MTIVNFHLAKHVDVETKTENRSVRKKAKGPKFTIFHSRYVVKSTILWIKYIIGMYFVGFEGLIIQLFSHIVYFKC